MGLSKREKGSRPEGASDDDPKGDDAAGDRAGKDDAAAGGERPERSARRGRRGRDERPSLPARIVAALRSVASLLAAMAVGLYRLGRRGLRALEGPTAGLRRRLGALGAAASRVITPVRVLLVAAIGCAVLLGLSQFADYRGVAIGVDSYDAGIEAVAPAPEIDRAELGTAHSYLMVPAALIAIAILLLATRSRRWRLCRLAALVGIAAVVVAIVVDRPAGLDEGTLTRDFIGVEAKLLGGFWAQLVAGIGLIVTSLLLGSELRRAREKDPADAGSPRRRRRNERKKPRGERRPAKDRRRATPRAYPRVELRHSEGAGA